jgi:hypothetical protein
MKKELENKKIKIVKGLVRKNTTTIIYLPRGE